MTSHNLFLLVYILGSCFVASTTQRNVTCATSEDCAQVLDSTSQFLHCVNLPSTDTGRDHMQRLKGMLEATMNIYTFLRSSTSGNPLLTLEGALALNPSVDPLQNEDLVKMWMEVKMKPLLKSISKHFLACLSTKTLSCSSYQTMVMELSHYYSEMNPVRQKWIYTFFMYPFLSGDRVAGCVSEGESSEEWLMKNFGAFRAMARIQDFSTLNMVFSGLEVLHLLSPVQKAELLLRPEVASLDNGTLSLVFHSLLTGGSGPHTTANPGEYNKWTTPGHPQPTYYPYMPPPPQNSHREIVDGFMMALRPIGSFVHDFVSFTHERDVSEIRSTTLTRFMLNWTLSELADLYRNQTVPVDKQNEFDVTNVEDWYQQVVMPLLRRFLPGLPGLMHENITLAFHQVFYLDHGLDNDTSENLDVCSISLDRSPCGMTDAVQNVASVLHCAAQSNLTMSEAVIMRLIQELSGRLLLLTEELSRANVTELVSEFQQIFGEAESPSLTQEHLRDPDFIKLWFQIKLMPLLPEIPNDILSCLSMKDFSCPVYQTIVAELSDHMSFMDADPVHSQNIYNHFIYSFLLHHNTTDLQCVPSVNHSAEWIINNFGLFSRFASITDFYKLNTNFSALDVLHLLTPEQIAGLLLLPLPVLPEKDVVIDHVFDFLLESPENRQLAEVLQSLVHLAKEVNPPCGVYRHILVRLYRDIRSLPAVLEPFTWAGINALLNIAPEGCVPQNITCPVTQFNNTHICKGINSADLYSHMITSADISCDVSLQTYACAQLGNFTANQLASLLRCNLSRDSSDSKSLWKMLLTKLSHVLDPALDILANMSVVDSSATEILDVIGEIRLSLLTDEELMNSSITRKWFSDRLGTFLPAASAEFLHCLTHRNLSCQSYQQILQVFIHRFDNMNSEQQYTVFKNFVLRFLMQSGPACVSISNGTADWVIKNLGPFSQFLSLEELLQLNPYFKPLEVLQLLTPKQAADLLVVTLPTLPDKEVIINKIFDYLTALPDEMKLKQFLNDLVPALTQGNISCGSYKALFDRLDLAMATVSLDAASLILYTKTALSEHIPNGCVIYGGQCSVTMTNETDICAQVNSTVLQHHIDKGELNGIVCDFAVEEFACASLSALRAEDLAAMLACNHHSNFSSLRPVWKLFLSKSSHVLDRALDLLTNKTVDPRNPVVSVILDAIQEVRLDRRVILSDPALIQLWFNDRLRPFLPAVSIDFLSCLTTKGLNCITYQKIVQILSDLQPHMSVSTQMSVYTHFIKVFLTRNDSSDPNCLLHTSNSGDWLQRNLGGFSALLSFQDLQMLYPSFSAMEALPQLTIRQLADVSATPGQLTSPAMVNMVTRHIPNQHLSTFFDFYSPAIMNHENLFPITVRSAMLQVVFDRANLSDHSVRDSVVLQWLQNRLPPLLANLSVEHVAPFFSIVAGRNCSIEQLGVTDLNTKISSFTELTKTEIHNHIIQTLRGPMPLRCYGDSYNHSFYAFLESSFMSFHFPNLTTLLSLMPHDRMHQLVNSMPPSDLGDFLRRPDVVDNGAELCLIYNNYIRTPMFLEIESLPMEVRQLTLPCVWPVALSSSQRSEVDSWFGPRLHNYMAFLTKNLISPDSTINASCYAFQKLISTLGEYNYTTDFVRQDVFNTIRAYLRSASRPRCYNPSDPEHNSTAWFAEYIGPFMPFLTLEDLLTFGSAAEIQVFTVNPLNIALLNHSSLPLNLTNYYTELIYQQDSNFNPLLLPLLCRCIAPGPAFTQLTAEESIVVLHNLTTLCTDLDPQVSAALAGNLGDTIDATAIAVLGNESSGMSAGQIGQIRPQDLLSALSILSSVTGWNEGQARAIILSLMSSGMMQFNNASSLLMLGTLVMGLPVSVFRSISISHLLTASENPFFLTNLMTAPVIVQQAFVTQIISTNTNSEMIIGMVPDDLATQIPRARLLSFSTTESVLTTINRKKWKQQQVELFFNIMGAETSTTALGSVNNLSSLVLQGFTCTGVRTIKTIQVKRLIKACRRRGRNRVTLVETQLTCMYNYIKDDPEVSSFELYPPDVLLYYDYSLVPQDSCRSYFEQLGEAEFNVFSPTLSYKLTALFRNARTCLGITNTSLTKDNISVLGNMCCTLDGAYIENSDPSILDRLNSCSDLTSDQVVAVEALLQSGATQYGAPSTWDEDTLKNLGMLPLYLTSDFYDNFNKKTKRAFLRYFLRVIRRSGVKKQRIRRLKREIRKSIRNKAKRSTETECTVGMITQVTISDEAFPFDYDDITQFNCCLPATTVRDNLNSITEKVDQEDYLAIVLSKLREAYGVNTTIPENQVQLLGPASRVATNEDINLWSITQIDTLSALMDSSNGEWDPSLVKAVISKYLSEAGNTLGSTELNAIGGVNLCSLDTSTLRTISQQSLREADALTVANCSIEKKRELFTIAKQAFVRSTRSGTVSVSDYQLTQSYVGGADTDFVRSLSSSDVNMDMATFTSLDENVVLSLSVSEVQGLLGTNLADLKSYENQTLVQSWIRIQPQSQLDTLGLGLQGGRADTTTTTASTNTGSTVASSVTTTTTAGSHGDRVQAGASSLLIVLMALLITEHLFE